MRYQKSRDFAEDLGILKIVKIMVIFKECFLIRSLIMKTGICLIFSGIVGNRRELSELFGLCRNFQLIGSRNVKSQSIDRKVTGRRPATFY